MPGAVGDDREIVWAYVAYTLAARNDWTAAEALYRRAIAAQPTNARAQAGLAGVLPHQGHRAEAIAAAVRRAALATPAITGSFASWGCKGGARCPRPYRGARCSRESRLARACLCVGNRRSASRNSSAARPASPARLKTTPRP